MKDNRWQVIYSTRRVEKFIVDLDARVSSRVERMIDLLEKHGHDIGLPHSRSLGRGLFELRVLGAQQVRVFYVFRRNKIYIVHGFLKKTQRIPKKEIEYALRIAGEIVA